jgi:hypothetical protein
LEISIEENEGDSDTFEDDVENSGMIKSVERNAQSEDGCQETMITNEDDIVGRCYAPCTCNLCLNFI